MTETASKKTLGSRWGRRVLAATCGVGLAFPLAVVPAWAEALPAEVSLKILVLDDASVATEAIKDRLTSEGQRFTTIDLTSDSRQRITSDFLVRRNQGRLNGQFSGIVTPGDTPTQLADTERGLLEAYTSAFKVRTVVASTWAHPGVGLNYAKNPGHIGSIDGMRATVTSAGARDAFSYLRGTTFDDIDPNVVESYGYLATPLPNSEESHFTPLVTAPIPGTSESGSLVGVHSKKGRERLILTFSSNKYQGHWRALSHGVIRWLTRGISTTYNRNYFSGHVDDVLLPDTLWSEEGNCTIGDGCDPAIYPPDTPGGSSRMIPSDVSRLIAWQRTNGIKLDLVYNGSGADDERQENGIDKLEAELLRRRHEFRWINHTWSHPYLGCIQQEASPEWKCATDEKGRIRYASLSTIYQEIALNHRYARQKRLPNYVSGVLVTGEHSGLKTLPQMKVDNPNLAPALALNRIRWIGSDASRERDIRSIGTATTVPRHPMNIYYNTETKSQAVDEYNWIYTSKADGGSGLCERFPETMTCIKPLDKATGFDSYIVPIEARIALGHVLTNDPRPHYLHQSNLASEGIIYPVLDRVLEIYRRDFAENSPIVNPTMQDSGVELTRQSNWKRHGEAVAGTVAGQTLAVQNTAGRRIEVPLTLPRGSRGQHSAFGSSYGDEASAWETFRARQTRVYRLPTSSGFATTVAWPPVPPAPEKPVEQRKLPDAPVAVSAKNEADSEVLEAATQAK